ncbi:hypothetical protein Gotur_003562 [Gossypium turneri]
MRDCSKKSDVISDQAAKSMPTPQRVFLLGEQKMDMPKQVTVRDLVEEGKKRIVILAICVVGLSYLMSR